MTGEPRPDTLDAIIDAILPALEEAQPVATLWATVDAERAVSEFRVEVPSVVETLRDDPLLGATIRLVSPERGDAFALAEPNTEGRLAATLARFGEGPAGRYVATTLSLADVARRAAAAGIAISRPADGPFGRSVLVLGGSAAGPHLILVEEAAGTIDR